MTRGQGLFTIQTSVDIARTSEAIREVLANVRHFVSAPVSADELTRAKGATHRRFQSEFSTLTSTVHALSELAAYGLPLDDYAAMDEQIDRITPEELLRVAKKHIRPDDLRVFIVADASRVSKELEGLGLGPVVLRRSEPVDRGGEGHP
jgi:predicted Zn-dependent peptidase